MSKHRVVTFGCRLNSFESEVIKDVLSGDESDRPKVVFNSCAVTKEAERQLRQSLRRVRREQPDAEIIVTGCAAQIDPSKYAVMEEVDRVLGNEEKMQASSYGMDVERVAVNDIMSVTETASHMVDGFEGRARAFVQVQNGCNHRCTFCIIPFGRGNSRSVPVGEIVSQVQKLVDAGYQEVVLTGVDITDYGLDLPGVPRLGEMVRRLFKLVPGLPRLRLSSIDVAEVDDVLFDVIVSEPRFMPYLHLSLQSGDNMVLKRMKRRHTREQVLEFCKKVKALRPEVTFGADIIAGFPTETDAMFDNTYQLVETIGIPFLHVFPYSEREGTPAAKMPAVDPAIRKSRARALRRLSARQLDTLLASKVGKTEVVVVEEGGKGRCEDYCLVDLPGSGRCEVGAMQEVVV